MAIVPQTIRNRLASSVVGTAGVDRSGEILAGGVQAGLQEVEQFGQKKVAVQAREDRRLRLQAESDNRAQNRKVTAAQEDTSANLKSIEYNSALGKLREEGLAPEEYEKRQKELLDSTLEGLGPITAGKFTGRIRELTQRSADKNLKSDTDRKTTQIKQDLDDSLQSTIGSIDSTFSDPGTTFGDKLNSFDDDVELYTAVLQQQRERGVMTDTQFRAASGGSALKLGRVAVNSIMENQPEKLDQFLAQNGDIFTAEQQQELRKEAKDFTDRRIAEIKQAKELSRFNISTSVANRITSGEDVSLNEIDEAVLNDNMTESEARAARRVIKSSKAVFAGDDASTFNELQTELSSILFEEMDPGEDPELVEDQKFPFEKVSRFRQRTLEALEKGNISNTTAQKLLKRVTPIFNESTKDMLGRLNIHTTQVDWWFDKTREVLTEDELVDANLFLQKEMMDRIDKFETDGKIATLRQVKDIMDEVQKDWVLQINPNNAQRKIGEVFTSTGGKKVKVVGFDTDGEPIVNTDLVAPVIIPFSEKK